MKECIGRVLKKKTWNLSKRQTRSRKSYHDYWELDFNGNLNVNGVKIFLIWTVYMFKEINVRTISLPSIHVSNHGRYTGSRLNNPSTLNIWSRTILLQAGRPIVKLFHFARSDSTRFYSTVEAWPTLTRFPR